MRRVAELGSLVGTVCMENIADYLFARRARSLPPRGLAEVFARLIWTMDDNGDEIVQTMRRWITSGDIEQARIALAMREVFFYPTRDAMTEAFDQLCLRFPECRRDCNEIISEWDRQHVAT